MLKKLLLFGVCYWLLATPALAGEAMKGPGWLKAGTKLTFGVEAKSKSYDFLVTVKQLSPDLELDWTMTPPVSKSGTLHITAGALDTAVKQKNSFKGGADLLSDATSVWVSRKVYEAVAQPGGKIVVDSGSGEESLFAKGEEDITVVIDGVAQALRVIHAESDKGNSLWILKDAAAPVILRMNLGWSLAIKEIASAK